jgi:bacterioferritin-associated ferredoxin
MMVCLCNGVGERKVRKAIDHGASTVDEVTAACAAGGRCGGCRPTIAAMLQAAEVCDREDRGVRVAVA